MLQKRLYPDDSRTIPLAIIASGRSAPPSPPRVLALSNAARRWPRLAASARHSSPGAMLPIWWQLASGVAIFTAVAAIIRMIVCAATVAGLYAYRAHSAIRGASPLFLAQVAVGLALMSLGLIFWAAPDATDDSCQAFQWLSNLGFTLSFAPLFAKTWRIDQIFSAKRIKVVKITNARLIWVVGAMIATELLVVSIWSGVSPLQPVVFEREAYQHSHSMSAPAPASLPASLTRFQTLQLRWAAPGVLNVHLSVGKLNAMSQRFWREYRECFHEIAQQREVRVVLVTAQGKVFTAGLDLQDHGDSFLTSSAGDVARKTLRMKPEIQAYQESFSAMEACPQPVIVAIQGACIGGGVDLITAADIRYASEQAWFSVKEVDVGMAADVGTLQRLPRVVSNAGLVREWCYTGRKITAQEALSSGLVSRVLPTAEALLSESLALAVQIASKSPLAVAGTKVNLLYARDHSVRDGLDYVAQWNASALQSEDVLKAMEASMSKQTPIYSNL